MLAQPALQTIRVVTDAEDQTTPFLYAVKAGLFRNAGIQIDMTEMRSGAAVAAAMAGGAADIGKSSILSLLGAYTHGVPFRLIAPAGIYEAAKPDIGLLVAKSSTIRSAKDLVGKAVAVTSLHGLNEIATRAWLEQNGVDSNTVRFIEMPVPTETPALLKGTIDAITLANPTYQEALDTDSIRVLAPMYSAIGQRFLEASWFTTTSYAKAHRELLERFERVIRQANIYTNSHHEETSSYVASFAQVNPATVARMQRVLFPSLLDPADVQPIIDAAARFKVIEKPFPAQEIFSDVALKN